MRIPVPDELLPADRLGRVHFVGIGGAGLSGDRPDHAGARRRRSPAATTTTRRSSPALRELGVDLPPRLRRRARRRRRHPRRHHRGRARTTPRSSRRRRRGLRILPRSAGLAVGDGRPARASRSPAPTARPRPPRCSPSRCSRGRRRPDVRRRRRARRDRPQRRRRHRRPVRGRGRRERRRLPRLPPARRDRHQRRGRPPRQVGDRGGLPRGLRRRSLDRIDPDGFLVCCVDDAGAAALAGAGPRPRPRGRHGGRGRRRRRPRRPTSRFAGATSRVHRRATAASVLGDGRPADPRPPLRPRRAGRARRRPRARATPSTACAAGSRRSPAPGRRMERKGEAGGVRVYDSYAHHPTEIAGDLAGRPGAWPATAGWSSPSSRTWSRAPGSSAPRWARRSAPPTRSSSSTSTSPARTPTPP